jgi:murein DD-endopeptidase MepM/ murein hydrolase activator NlpD
MKAQKMRLIVLTLLVIVLWMTQNGDTSKVSASVLPQTQSVASVFSPPLGYQSGTTFAPRQTYDTNSALLIEDTEYGVKNPDLNNPSTCFGFDWRDLYHAGEDLYNDDNPSATVEGEIVSAVANGTVSDISDPQQIWYEGYAVTIKHILPSGQEVYSVYIHLNTVNVSIGETVSLGQQLGTVIYQPYRGLYQNYHSTDDSHLHFEIRYFPDARGIYAGYPNCEKGDVAGRGYTPPDIHPDNFPAPGGGYTDPSNFIASHGVPTATATSTPVPATPTLPTSTSTATTVTPGVGGLL